MSDRELQQTVQAVLRRDWRPSVSVKRIARRPFANCTSAAIEQLDVELVGGRSLRMVLKDTSRDAMHERARRAKPSFLHDPRREIEIYRRVLASHPLGTSFCYGAMADDAARRYWLFLERVTGVELFQVGELTIWQRVAHWLASMHLSFARGGLPLRAPHVRAPTLTANYYRLWLDRTRAFFDDRHVGGSNGVGNRLDWLASRYEAVIERLVALPVTLIHGELYASNVLVEKRRDGLRICPVDWEMAAVGPGLLDLAALTAGTWSEPQRRDIAMAYYSALAAHDAGWPSPQAFLGDLVCCRIQIAVQWLGWFGRRRPPAEHARDWLREAVDLAEQAGL